MARAETELKGSQEGRTKRQGDTKAMKTPRQTTIWIDGDLYEAMSLAKARGKGSLKEQINGALRRVLGVEDAAALEARERQAYLDKPWNAEDDDEVASFDEVRAFGDEWQGG